MYGSPLSKKRYLTLLHPRKVYLLNCAIFSQFTKIKYIRLALESYYYHSHGLDNDLIKDIPYGSQDNTLDLHMPIATKENKKVYVFVYGGTWSSGSKKLYASLCRNLANEKNALVVCPDYSIYPKGFVDDMVECIVDVIGWIYLNIDHYGGNKNDIVLIGHSAGAHLIMMAMFELEQKIRKDPSELSAQLFSSVKEVIGLSGVYEIGQHYGYETARGVQDISKMSRVFYDGMLFSQYSPSVRVKDIHEDIRFPAITLIHGSVDRTVPLWSSQVFHAEIVNSKNKNIKVTLTEIQNCGHAEIVMCLFDRSRTHYKDIMSLI